MGNSKQNQLSEIELELQEILNGANNDKKEVEKCTNAQGENGTDNITAEIVTNNEQRSESTDKSEVVTNNEQGSESADELENEKTANLRQEIRNLNRAVIKWKRNSKILQEKLDFSYSESISLQQIIDKRDAQIENLKGETNNLKKNNEKLCQSIERLSQSIVQKDEEIENLKRKNLRLSENILQKDGEIIELERYKINHPESNQQNAFWKTTKLIAEIAFFPAKTLSDTIIKKINRN